MEDEYVDCPYCHAASPAQEFTAGSGHCPFCGAANYELDGYMGHLGARLAADMSHDDVIKHIDEVLAEGEGHDLHNFPGADRDYADDPDGWEYAPPPQWNDPDVRQWREWSRSNGLHPFRVPEGHGPFSTANAYTKAEGNGYDPMDRGAQRHPFHDTFWKMQQLVEDWHEEPFRGQDYDYTNREASTHRTAASNDDVTRAVRDATGINLSMTNAGGGAYVFDGRLDDGSWLVASDSEGYQHGDMNERTEEEQQDEDEGWGGPLGWTVGVYPDGGEEGWFGQDAVHHHSDDSAYVHELPRVIQEALQTMPRNQRHSSLRAASPARWHPSGLGGGDREAPGEYTFDWRDVSGGQDEYDGVDHMTPEEFDAFTNHYWQADLENGHSLHIQEDDPSLTGSGKREYYPSIRHPGDPSGSSRRYPEETNLGKWFRSRADAQQAIERAYTEKYPIGSDVPRAPRDSGVDYDSLFKPDDLDEDFGHILGSVRAAAAGMSWEDTMKYIDDTLAAGDQEPEHYPDGRRHWPTDWEARTAPLEELYDAYHDYDHSGFNEGPHVEHAWEELKRRHEEGEVDDPDRGELADWYRNHSGVEDDDDDHYTNRTGSTMNRTAAIDFVAAQNTRDRDELLFRAHRHASQLTCRLTVPEAQRAVRAFVAAVNREALRTAATPEDEACGDCGAEAGEECRFYCTGKAAHDDEVAEGKKRKKGSRRTAAVIADFPDELMF